MATNFPDSPNVNDEFTNANRTWVWDGTVWADKGSTLSFSELADSAHATTHELGGSDELQLDASQVSNLELDNFDESFLLMG